MMEREDMVALGEKTLDAVIAHPPKDARSVLIRVTSGTSGNPPLVLATGYAPEAPADMAGSEGLGRVVSCMGSLFARLANALIVSRVPARNVMQVLPLDPQDLTPELPKIFREYQPEIIYGFCSYIARVARYMTPDAAKNVRSLMFSGEGVNDVFDRLFSEQFPNAARTEFYMANDAGGYIGKRMCRYLPRNHFHPPPGVVVAIDAPEDGIGDILVSKSIFRSLRVDRYRIGDIGRLIEQPCPCGEKVTLELFGRKGIDYIKLAGAILRREEFDRVVALFPDVVDDYRVEARQVVEGGRPKGQVILRIYHRKGSLGRDALREFCEKFARELFLTPTKTLADLSEEGIFKPLQVELSEHPFAEGHKDVKLVLRA